jgi:hypothetical protein
MLGSVVNGQSLNRFAFVEGRPVRFVDPIGHWGLLSTAVALAPVGYSLYKSYSGNSSSNSSTQPSESSYSPVTATKNTIKAVVYAVDAYADSTGSHKLGHIAHKVGDPTTATYLGYSAYSGYQENGLTGAKNNVTVDAAGFVGGHAAAKICVAASQYIPHPAKIVVSVGAGVICYFLGAYGASAYVESALEPCYNAGQQFGSYLYDQSPSYVSTGLNMMWEDAWSGNLDIWWFGY